TPLQITKTLCAACTRILVCVSIQDTCPRLHPRSWQLFSNIATSAKEKGNKTLSLTNFLAEDKGGNAPPSYPPTKPTSSWAEETDDLDTEVSTSWHTEEDISRAPAIDRSILPTALRSAREPNVDRSCIPCGPPYTAFLGNLPYDVTEESIMDFFRGVGISAVHLPREPSNQDRSKGFGYAEFDDVESLLSALSLNKENFGNRRILVDIADWSCWGSGDHNSDRGGDRYDRPEESHCDRGAVERPKLILKPCSLPKEVEQSSAPSAPSDRAASIFGGAKPVDTAAKEREVEERLKREQEKLQRELEDRITDHNPRERHPSWRSEDQPAGRSQTGSESSQTRQPWPI
ncbi:eukaryotic translation initiation factor 4B-like, partial [Oncorhynchus keta]|uniref:eukaryotic translation initiation factor 4B-like n=1 Tax=Oncorhynchus keta TaxID=8018 RepID=UPI00227CC3DA